MLIVYYNNKHNKYNEIVMKSESKLCTISKNNKKVYLLHIHLVETSCCLSLI